MMGRWLTEFPSSGSSMIDLSFSLGAYEWQFDRSSKLSFQGSSSSPSQTSFDLERDETWLEFDLLFSFSIGVMILPTLADPSPFLLLRLGASSSQFAISSLSQFNISARSPCSCLCSAFALVVFSLSPGGILRGQCRQQAFLRLYCVPNSRIFSPRSILMSKLTSASSLLPFILQECYLNQMRQIGGSYQRVDYYSKQRQLLLAAGTERLKFRKEFVLMSEKEEEGSSLVSSLITGRSCTFLWDLDSVELQMLRLQLLLLQLSTDDSDSSQTMGKAFSLIFLPFLSLSCSFLLPFFSFILLSILALSSCFFFLAHCSGSQQVCSHRKQSLLMSLLQQGHCLVGSGSPSPSPRVPSCFLRRYLSLFFLEVRVRTSSSIPFISLRSLSMISLSSAPCKFNSYQFNSLSLAMLMLRAESSALMVRWFMLRRVVYSGQSVEVGEREESRGSSWIQNLSSQSSAFTEENSSGFSSFLTTNPARERTSTLWRVALASKSDRITDSSSFLSPRGIWKEASESMEKESSDWMSSESWDGASIKSSSRGGSLSCFLVGLKRRELFFMNGRCASFSRDSQCSKQEDQNIYALRNSRQLAYPSTKRPSIQSYPRYFSLKRQLQSSSFCPPKNPADQTVLKQVPCSLLIFLYMKHLEDALGHPRASQSFPHPSNHRQKSRQDLERWALDPDFVEESAQAVRERLTQVISAALRKKFQSQKYLQEETFRDLLQDLLGLFPDHVSEVEKLGRMEDILQSLADSFSGDLKNHLKQFQSLLDAKIRKLKKKGKRAELVEYQRILAGETRMRRKKEACFINEDDRGRRQLKRMGSKVDTSKRSFGTINSASNENESGSGKNQSGSGSKSGQSNALTVLLANIDATEERKGKNKEKQKEKYEFTSILNATASVRQRNNVSRSSFLHQHSKQELRMEAEKEPPEEASGDDKDEAFIFHHPKRAKHSRI